MKQKQNYLLPVFSAILFVVLIIILKTVDVRAVGPLKSEVGLSHLNLAALNFFGSSEAWFEVTEVLGLFAIASGGIFAVVGLIQLIKRKSLIKVDREILSLGGLYAVLGIVYVFFDKVTVNLRPMLAPDETIAESSFPSSHTVLTVVIMGSILMLLDKYIKNKTARQILSSVCTIICVITVVGRLLSGVHWLTDILGGIILSVFLLSVFKLFINK